MHANLLILFMVNVSNLSLETTVGSYVGAGLPAIGSVLSRASPFLRNQKLRFLARSPDGA
jgi:hypothetical protein